MLSKCKAYQFLKRNTKQYWELPSKEAEIKSCDSLCAYLIGKYQIISKGGGKKFQIIPEREWMKSQMTSAYLQAVIITDPATGQMEMHRVPSIWADLVANHMV